MHFSILCFHHNDHFLTKNDLFNENWFQYCATFISSRFPFFSTECAFGHELVARGLETPFSMWAVFYQKSHKVFSQNEQNIAGFLATILLKSSFLEFQKFQVEQKITQFNIFRKNLVFIFHEGTKNQQTKFATNVDF